MKSITLFISLFIFSAVSLAAGFPYNATYRIGIKSSWGVPMALVTGQPQTYLEIGDAYADIYASGGGYNQAEADAAALAECNLYNTATFTSNTVANNNTYWTIAANGGKGPLVASAIAARKMHGRAGNWLLPLINNKAVVYACEKVS